MDIVISLDFPPDIGGAHHWLYEVYRRWPKQVAVFTSQSPADLQAAMQVSAFDKSQLGSLKIYRKGSNRREINLTSLPYIIETLAQARYIAKLARSDQSVTRLHSLRAFPEGFIGLVTKRLYQRDAILVTYAHGEEVLVAKTSRQLSAMARWVYKESDIIIANSSNTENLVRRMCPAARIVRVHPGVDKSLLVDCQSSVRERVRSNQGWSQDAFILFSVARMEPRKNQAMVIRAVALLRSKGFDIRYICAGDGEMRHALELLAQELNIQESVVFPGRISDAEKYENLQGADAHIMVSIQHGSMIEGFGIVFIEAAAAGIPSIAGNSGGQAEAVLDGKTGLVVDGTSLDQVSEAILKLIIDQELRYHMSVAAKAWAAEHEWEHVVQRTVTALNELGIAIL